MKKYCFFDTYTQDLPEQEMNGSSFMYLIRPHCLKITLKNPHVFVRVLDIRSSADLFMTSFF